MTSQELAAWLAAWVCSDLHTMRIIEDKDFYRAVCSCGWCSLPEWPKAHAEAVTCGVEKEQREGARRLERLKGAAA